MPRFDQSFNGLREQNLQETQQLKQRYLDGKNKRVPKAKDKKQQDSIQSSVHVQQKFLKRGFDEHDPGNEGSFEPPVKLQCTTQHQGHQPDGCTTKFSVEIVQQLEFTTSAASSQPQQISTNVTVKAHTNASMKTGVPSPIPNPDTPKSTENNNGNNGQSQNVNAFAGCVKQEPEMDFADLDQCAAALEKDANGGNGFPLADLLNENTPEAAAYLQDFLFELDDIKGYIFDEKKDVEGLKVEDLKDIPSVDNSNKAVNSPLNQNYSPPVYEKNRLPYSNLDFGKTEMSPAAQTLKQMAEQHQNKNQMGLSYNPNNRTPTARSPYPEFPIADYGSPNNNFHRGNASYPQPDIIKQEMMFQGSEYETKRKGAGVYKQQYSPYGSPSASGHGSPGYLPGRGSAASNNGPTSNNSFGAGTPPRPPSGPGGANSTTTTLQINQAQQLHINQQGHGHNIQVSAGQHLHLSGDLKGNVSVAAQQAMHFSQHSSSSTNSGPNTQQQQQQQQQHHQQSQNTSPQQNNAHVPHQNHQNPNAQHANPVLSNQHPNLQSSLSGMSNPMSNQMGNSMNNSMNNPNIPSSMPTNIQSPGVGTSMHSPLSGLQGSAMGNMPNGMGMMGSNGVGSGHGAHIGGQNVMGDGYSLSQSQTINFTQQTLRQRSTTGANVNGIIPAAMASAGNQFGGPMNPRHMAPQNFDPKLLQQQQLLRAQAQNQQHVRPPPPDYKTTAGMMQGMQPRYSNPPSNMRRMPHQPLPAAGPMVMRPQHGMFVSQQQHMQARGMYPRQQAPMTMPMENMPQAGTIEWRQHMMMAQQQNTTYSTQMRPNYQQGFNSGVGNVGMPITHQMRMQQNMAGGTMTAVPTLQQGMSQNGMGMNSGPINHLNGMTQQQMLQLQQQQQQQQQHQQQQQMSMSTLHMQQSQSVTISNQNAQQQQQMLLGSSSANNQASMNNFSNAQANDFSLEFFDNPDAGEISAQELLSSFDQSGFLRDMLN